MTPVARRGDPQTSWDAARSVSGLRDSQRRVLALLLEFGPMTDEEVVVRHRERWPELPLSYSGLRTRRAELVAVGEVFDTGALRPMASGRRGIVWRARRDAPLPDPSVWDEPEPGDAEPVYAELPE